MVVKGKLKDDPAPYRAASPLYQIGPDAPPMFVLHGTNDSLVPVEQARLFVERLRETSKETVAYAELPLAQHAFDLFGSVRAAATAEAIGRFLGVIYGREQARAEPCAQPMLGGLSASTCSRDAPALSSGR